jgi:murein L,D-transpeptidase YafK
MPEFRKFLVLIAAAVFCVTGNSALSDSSPLVTGATRLPAYLLEIPESVSDILIASAETATMHRFVRSDDGVMEKDQRYMSIGQNGIGKERAWDKKTPLGVYFITEKLDTSKLHDKYGVAAFPLDYPNAWDRHNQRTGDGIWLHGVDHNNPQRPPLDTDGCLSLPNEEILRLADDLQPLVTPVIVARELKWATRQELQSMRQEFRLALDIWRRSQEKGDLLTYLALYADDFSYHDMSRIEWSAWRMGVFEASPLQSVEISELMLVADPEVAGLYLSRFKQVLTTKNGPITTTKRLYWRRSTNNTWRIVAEGSG